MLATEILVEIFANLSRDELEALQLVDTRFHDITVQNFADGPRRLFHKLTILGHNDYSLWTVARTIDSYDVLTIRSDEELVRRMRFAALEGLRFVWDMTMDDTLFSALLPIRSSWRNSLCTAPKRYSSADIFERTFSELLVCWKISVECAESLTLTQSFMSLEGIQWCQSLELWDPPSPVDASDIATWLHRASEWKRARYLRVAKPFAEAQLLLAELRKAFLVASEACSYFFTLRCTFSPHALQNDVLLNRATSECLKIFICGGLFIHVIREAHVDEAPPRRPSLHQRCR
ncbi:hypothetical protein AAVH_34946 [Aphelenchoides avenae]|nr:hypothetical protein AAVH_34946 [Aphelenchus avenae]